MQSYLISMVLEETGKDVFFFFPGLTESFPKWFALWCLQTDVGSQFFCRFLSPAWRQQATAGSHLTYEHQRDKRLQKSTLSCRSIAYQLLFVQLAFFCYWIRKHLLLCSLLVPIKTCLLILQSWTALHVTWVVKSCTYLWILKVCGFGSTLLDSVRFRAYFH